VKSALGQSLVIAAALASFVAVIADRPEKRPGNLAPIQMITALGACSLLVVNSVIAALACVTGLIALAVAPVATVVSAAVVFARSSSGERSTRSLPEQVVAVIAEIRDLLGGARRLGLDQIDAVLVSSNGPRIGVAVPARGRVVVRVHESVAAWIDRHHRQRGASAISSFIRFAVLHELGHILNGDHRTYRFARAVLVAHLWWGVSLLAAALSWAGGRAADARVILIAAAFVALLVAGQSLISRRFIAERERLADWRAMQSLSMPDAARLLRRKGVRRGGRDAPTEIEKLLIDLKSEPAPSGQRSFLNPLICLIWPEGDSVHHRAESLAAERSGAAPRPVRWAMLAGLQCGVLATSLAIGVLLTVGPLQVEMQLWVVIIVMSWIAGPASTYCAMRTDPARMSVRGHDHRRGQRIETGIVFFATFVAPVLIIDRLARWLGTKGWVPGVFLATTIVMIAIVIGGCVWIAGIAGSDGGGELRVAPREQWVNVAPLLIAMAVVLVPINVMITSWLGWGGLQQGWWVAIMLCSFAAYVLSTAMARSTNMMLRALAPMAVLDTPVPVFGLRLFWREMFVDLARCSLWRAGAVILTTQTAALLFFVLVITLAMHRVEQFADLKSAFTVVVFAAFALFALVLLVPDRYSRMRGRTLRLVDRSRLELFLALLKSVRRAGAAAAERLENALVRWMSDERLVLVLLPDRRTLWPLSPLLTFVRLARTAGATGVLDRTRGRIEEALRAVIDNDAVALAPDEPPSLFYSTLAATIIEEMDLIDCFPYARMLDRIEAMLRERMAGRSVNLFADVVAAARLLQAHGRVIPSAVTIGRVVRRSTLLSKPKHRQSLVELCELAGLLGDANERERLAPVVRSRMWEILQLNPRKEVLALLDCYLAAAHLGEGDSPLASAAAATIAEIANRTANELTTVEQRLTQEEG